ncbi:MerR family transcriptional regulator [Planotetraspora mira]|uniref:MerR family transcriptional regulator n=1 Tax=Planotetraspora mira TaxID=58121 RepID=A0A8J3X4I7_9ACTN|nr:MerR family transcriptional regulator [Planotetraspora mira]GII27560.1 MerR family transcriptional regulator [Planotetraspora mira]
MKIGDLAAKTGVAPRLLRYYEEVGILHPFRSSNGYRTYGEPAIDRVLQIRELLESGFTTEMIREVLPCLEAAKEETEAPACPAVKDLDGLRRQLSSIERRIDVLQRNRHAIETYLRAWEDAMAATPTAADGVPVPVSE